MAAVKLSVQDRTDRSGLQMGAHHFQTAAVGNLITTSSPDTHQHKVQTQNSIYTHKASRAVSEFGKFTFICHIHHQPNQGDYNNPVSLITLSLVSALPSQATAVALFELDIDACEPYTTVNPLAAIHNLDKACLQPANTAALPLPILHPHKPGC